MYHKALQSQADSTLTFCCTHSLRPQCVCVRVLLGGLSDLLLQGTLRVTYLPRCVYKLEMILLPIYCDQLCESYKERE